MQVRRLKWGTVKSGRYKGKPRPKLHTVGGVGGLYLQCSPPAPGNTTFARSWILNTPVGNSRAELGLGPYPEVTLGIARAKACEFKEQIRQGIDPRASRKAARSALLAAQAKSVTVRRVCENFATKKTKEYKTLKQTKKLNSQLETYVYPALGDVIVGDIERARWKGNLDQTLPMPGKISKLQHFRALPVEDLPSFMQELPRFEDNDLVFVSPRGKVFSDMTLTKVIKSMGRTVTQHGFRATFRTWAQDHTGFPEEVCELALAHVNSDATRAAYARSELLEKRRLLMADWEHFCFQGLREGKVVNIGNRKNG